MTRCKLSFLRSPGVGDSARVVNVRLTGLPPFDLAEDERKSVFLEGDHAQLVICQGQRVLLHQQSAMADGHILDLRLEPVPTGFWGRLLGRKAVRLVEVSRAPLPSEPAPTLKRPLIHQMWFGHVENEDRFFSFFGENPAFYTDENMEAEGTAAHVPLSEFAQSQQAVSYDHDFFEPAFAKGDGTLEERFKGMSWVALWAPVVRDQVPREVWENATVAALMNVDSRPGKPTYHQIRNPQDAQADGVRLTYVGEITHPDYA